MKLYYMMKPNIITNLIWFNDFPLGDTHSSSISAVIFFLIVSLKFLHNRGWEKLAMWEQKYNYIHRTFVPIYRVISSDLFLYKWYVLISWPVCVWAGYQGPLASFSLWLAAISIMHTSTISITSMGGRILCTLQLFFSQLTGVHSYDSVWSCLSYLPYSLTSSSANCQTL